MKIELDKNGQNEIQRHSFSGTCRGRSALLNAAQPSPTCIDFLKSECSMDF